jgi:hypothetical protein
VESCRKSFLGCLFGNIEVAHEPNPRGDDLPPIRASETASFACTSESLDKL